MRIHAQIWYNRVYKIYQKFTVYPHFGQIAWHMHQCLHYMRIGDHRLNSFAIDYSLLTNYDIIIVH